MFALLIPDPCDGAAYWKMDICLHHFLVLAKTNVGTRLVLGSINLSSKMVTGYSIYLAQKMPGNSCSLGQPGRTHLVMLFEFVFLLCQQHMLLLVQYSSPFC
jgi:hypothetical protein